MISDCFSLGIVDSINVSDYSCTLMKDLISVVCSKSRWSTTGLFFTVDSVMMISDCYGLSSWGLTLETGLIGSFKYSDYSAGMLMKDCLFVFCN